MTHPKTALTAEGAQYWLRSYHWSHVEAAYLLHGHDPRSVKAKHSAVYLLAIVEDTLAEIARTSGPKATAVRPPGPWDSLLSVATYACDQWPPAKWLEAARIADIPIPAVLSEAAARRRAFTEEAHAETVKVGELSKTKPAPANPAGRKGYDWPKFVELALRLYGDGVTAKPELLGQTIEWYMDLKGRERPGDERAEDYISAILRGIKNEKTIG